MTNKTMGRLIAGRRKELGMTQKQLAERLNVTDRAVSRWERGVGAPEISLIAPLAAALQVSADELLEGAVKFAEPPHAPAPGERKAGIPLFYHYLRITILLAGCLIVLAGIILGTCLPSFSVMIALTAVGIAIMLAAVITTLVLYRCPLCGHVLWRFNPRASQYQIQRCCTCGKALYSNGSVRTFQEYLQSRNAR